MPPTPARPSGPGLPRGARRFVAWPRYAAWAALPLCLLAAFTSRPAWGADLDVLTARYEAIASDNRPEGYQMQRRALEAIADLKTDAARGRLQELLLRHGPGSPMRAVQLLGALARRGGPDDIDRVIKWIEDRRDELLLAMLPVILERALEPSAGRHLREDVVRRVVPAVRAEVLRALGRRKDADAWSVLLRHLSDPVLDVRLAALEGIGDLGDLRARLPVELLLRDEDPRIRDAAARALGALADKTSLDALARATEDDDRRVAESAALALGRLEDARCIQPLIAMLRRHERDDLRLADAATDALRSLSGKSIAPDADLWQAWWDTVKDRPFVPGGVAGPAVTMEGPRYHDQPIRSSRLVFVLDVSRSMGWNRRLESAKDELTRTLESLPPTTRFNVITFDDRAHIWRSEMVRASSGNVSSAVKFVRALRPGNGTNTHGALSKAFHEEEVDTIYLLSDGHPSVGLVTDGEMIRLAVAGWNRHRRVRIHTMALMRGDPPPAFAGREDPPRAIAFLEALAIENGGTFTNLP
ncbi:MAG: HEAT repeat domain-containing protein [Planctomycetota bacterium]